MRVSRRTVTRLGLAVAGFAAALGAVTLEDHRLGWAAILLLAASLLLRLLQRDLPPV